MGEASRARLESLDAFRGFVMMVLVLGPVLAVAGSVVDRALPFPVVARQFEHAPWQGCTIWDLVMPSFMLMVGVSLPYSVASRRASGGGRAALWRHVLQRSAIFLVLGLILTSRGEAQTRFNFTGLLTQFGLAYPFAVLFVGQPTRSRLAWGLGLLVATWLAFALHPLPGPEFDPTSLGLPPDIEALPGFFAHWNRGTNFAADFDRVFLNGFPQAVPYLADPIGNQTLNFVPGVVTMALGVHVGELVRATPDARERQRALVRLGGGLLVAGGLAGLSVCPLVKSLWTPSWVLFSGGAAILGLASFHGLVEVRGWRAFSRPLQIVGLNSLVAYLLNSIGRPWIEETIRTHLVSRSWTLVQILVALTIFLACLQLHRSRIYVRA